MLSVLLIPVTIVDEVIVGVPDANDEYVNVFDGRRAQREPVVDITPVSLKLVFPVKPEIVTSSPLVKPWFDEVVTVSVPGAVPLILDITTDLVAYTPVGILNQELPSTHSDVRSNTLEIWVHLPYGII